MAACIDAVEAAFVAYTRGRAELPGVIHLDVPEARRRDPREGRPPPRRARVRGEGRERLLRPRAAGDRRAGARVRRHGRRAASRSCSTAGSLTDQRTGRRRRRRRAVARAASASTRVAVIGTGIQARRQVEALRVVRPALGEIRVWGRDARARGRGRRRRRRRPSRRRSRRPSRGADVVVTCTAAREPLVDGRRGSRRGAHVTAVGSDGAGKQELDPELLRRADVLVVDALDQCRRLGELQHAPGAGGARGRARRDRARRARREADDGRSSRSATSPASASRTSPRRTRCSPTGRAEAGERSSSESAQAERRAHAVGPASRRRTSSCSTPFVVTTRARRGPAGRPRTSVHPPAGLLDDRPASAAKSQMARACGSSITSAEPRATSMCAQKSPNPRSRQLSCDQPARRVRVRARRAGSSISASRTCASADLVHPAHVDRLAVHRRALAADGRVALAQRGRARDARRPTRRRPASAISVAQTGIAAGEVRGARRSGRRSTRGRRGSCVPPSSSPRIAVVGERRRDVASRIIRSIASVGLGHERAVGLALGSRSPSSAEQRQRRSPRRGRPSSCANASSSSYIAAQPTGRRSHTRSAIGDLG